MKKRTLFIILAAVMVLVLSSVPAMADNKSVDTKVTVIGGGGGSAPIIKAMWVQDTTPYLEDGDPAHVQPGSQFLPPMKFEGKKDLEFWVVVTDPEGVSTIQLVEINVYYPDGAHKFQLILEKVDKWEVGIPAYQAALSSCLVKYGPGYDHANVQHQLDQSLSAVYMATGYMHYHQPAGTYAFCADAMDTFGNWASTDETDLCSSFWYIPVPALELDFKKVDYGTVQVGAQKMVGGDRTFLSKDGKPTVRNIGNTPVQIMVAQDDMGFGYSGIGADKEWNVQYKARLGHLPADLVYFEPGWAKGDAVPVSIPWTVLPNILPLCTTDKMDFGIEVIKSKPSVKCGEMLIGWRIPGPPNNAS